MKKTLLAAVLAASLFGGGSAAAWETKGPAAEPWEAPRTAVATLAQHSPRISGPSTFAMGIATLAGAGLLYWRRRSYLRATAALS